MLRENKKINLLTCFSVFGIFLLTGFLVTLIFSPIIKTNAENSSNTEISIRAIVSSVASLSVDAENLDLSVVPTKAGVFTSGSITATADANGTGGYELYFSSVDNETDMTHANPSIQDVIASDFNGTVTSSSMEKNKWGYSLDDTNYSKIPTLNSKITLANIDHYPTNAERLNTVYLGAKISSELASGIYSKTVTFSMLAHEDTPSQPTMQEFSCSTLTAGTTTTLVDARDSNEYTVVKANDGNCWMTQNLRLNGPITLTSTDSDVSSNYTLPTSNWGSNSNALSKLTDPYLLATNSTSQGNYYNFVAASAGTVTGEYNSSSATHSICPYGWKLPSITEYATLLSSHDIEDDAEGSAIAQSTPLSFGLTGELPYNSTSVSHQNEQGYWWSATPADEEDYYIMHIGTNGADAESYGGRYSGRSIRCVAR